MTLDELHQHAAALQAGDGPLAALGAELARVQDLSQGAAILEGHRDLLQQQAGREISEDDLEKIAGGTLALGSTGAAIGAQGVLFAQDVATAHLALALGQWRGLNPTG